MIRTFGNVIRTFGYMALGYSRSVGEGDDIDAAKTDNFTIKGYSGTAAETYANENGFTFIALDNEPETILGDADGDGEVTIFDATAIQRRLVSLPTQSYNATAADTDKDGEVTILDATAIQRHLASLPSQAECIIGKPI